nr:putative RNA-directed DNA polymerase [Tanacetum cinerariifolium]
MDVDMDALIRNGTWDKCILLQGKKPVGCPWIFTIKYKPDGTVERYKARLVAKGYTQTYEIDYSETFSPVAKINTLRVLFSIAANQGWPLHQFDVKNAFLHEELKKSIYGGPAWILSAFQTWRSLNDESDIKKLKEGLCAEFEMKDLGNLMYFLGIEVMRSPQGIFICQKKYILDLLAETEMIDCKPADTPMITNQKLFMKTKAKFANRDRYQRMVGKLIYLSHTRLDIAYAVGVVSQFMHQPQVDHMHAVLRIVKYLKGTTSHGVLFKANGHFNIQIFTDADSAGDKGNRRSTSGYFSLVGGNLVTWKSKKQKVVSLSSAEAEFRGIAKGPAEALWIRKLVSEIGLPPKESIRIMSDNKAAIQISENLVQHDRTKPVEVDRHFIKEKLEAGIIKLPFVKSEDQLANILTKAVGIVILHKCLNKLNFENESNPSHLSKKPNRAAVLICLFEENDVIYVILTKRSPKLSSYSGEVSLPGGRKDEADTDDIRTALREAEEEIGLDPGLVDVVTVLEPFTTKHLGKFFRENVVSGEVSLPGCRKDEADTDDIRTALREAEEEIGLDPGLVDVVTVLEPFTTKEKVTVVPVMGILWNKQAFNPVPNVDEVESIFYAPLEMFLKDENRRHVEKEFEGDRYLLQYFDFETDNKAYVIWALTAGMLIAAASLVYQRKPDFQPRMPKFCRIIVYDASPGVRALLLNLNCSHTSVLPKDIYGCPFSHITSPKSSRTIPPPFFFLLQHTSHFYWFNPQNQVAFLGWNQITYSIDSLSLIMNYTATVAKAVLSSHQIA